jgi:hypothetical protein
MPPAPQFDRLVATLAALVVMALAVFLLVRNQPISDPKLFFILRTVVSFATATLGATIPGFLNIRWTSGGLAIRAGGALALFVLTYVYTPNLALDPNNSIPQIRQPSQLIDKLEHSLLWTDRLDAAYLLKECGQKCRDAVPALRETMANASEDQPVRIAAAWALLSVDPAREESDAVEFLTSVLSKAEQSGASVLPEDAIEGLGAAKSRARSALHVLRAALCNRPGSTMAKAFAALQQVEGFDAASREVRCRK